MGQSMIGICRGCARNTDRTHEVVPGKPTALCLDCQKAWDESHDKKRAYHYVRETEASMGPSDIRQRLITDIISRAFMDLLYQLQRSRLDGAGRAST